MTDPFAVWITGLPASGKSTLARTLRRILGERGVNVAILESDELRPILTPNPRYDEEERDSFYHRMLFIGQLFLRHGVPVIFDATANLRRYRDRAREAIGRFAEVFVDCPLEVCEARDPKALYQKAREGSLRSLPGKGVPYEPPLRPEFVVRSDRERTDDAATRIAGVLLKEEWAFPGVKR
jgi:adenylylsulfate kinase